MSKLRKVARKPTFGRGKDVHEAIKQAHGSQVAAPGDLAMDDTLKAHRDEALKRGRRHKRPLKKTKHHFVAGSIGFVLAALAIFVGYSFYLLQVKQSYSGLAYNAAKVLPFTVSKVDGESVKYDDYLFILRQNVHYLVDFDGVGAERIDEKTEDGQKIIEQKKREALAQAEGYALINREAKRLGLKVEDKEVEDAIDELLANRGGSTRDELSTTLDAHYGWSLDDYKRFHKQVLLKRKVLSSMDEAAKAKIDGAVAKISAGVAFEEVAKEFSDAESGAAGGGRLGIVDIKLNTPNFSYTILERLKKLEEGKTSDVIITNDSFYIFKNVKTYSENEKDLQIIKIKFKLVEEYLAQLDVEGKIKRNIKLKAPEESVSEQ